MIFDTIQLGYTVCPSSWEVNDKSPLFNRIYYIVDGEAVLHYQGDSIKLNKSTVYIFPCMQPYSIVQNTNHPLEVLWIHIHTQDFLLTELLEIPILYNSTNSYFIKILSSLANKPQCECEFGEIFQTWVSYLNIEQPFCDMYQSDNYMCLISEFVDSRLHLGVSVQDVADYLNMERSYFSRIFKAKYNISPKYYLLSKRLLRASLLILQGNSIEKTAELTGYADEKTFSRAFKQYIELSPAAYRRKNMLQP